MLHFEVRPCCAWCCDVVGCAAPSLLEVRLISMPFLGGLHPRSSLFSLVGGVEWWSGFCWTPLGVSSMQCLWQVVHGVESGWFHFIGTCTHSFHLVVSLEELGLVPSCVAWGVQFVLGETSPPASRSSPPHGGLDSRPGVSIGCN